MRFGLIVLLLLFAALGATFGALNSEGVTFDFYFATMHLPKGAALLCAILIGWLAGGLLVYFGMVLRLRRRVNNLTRELRKRDDKAPISPVDAPTVLMVRKEP
jgi:lipopolysaccharide assembly protein A